MQLHWAAQTKFPCLKRLFGADRCAALPTAAGGECGPSGAAHPSDSCGGDLYQDVCRLRMPAGNCFRGSREVRPILVLRTAATHSIVAPHCGALREMQRSLCHVNLRSPIKKRCTCRPTSRPCRSLDVFFLIEEEFGMDPGDRIKKTGLRTGPCAEPIFITPSWFSAPPGHALTMGSLPDNWRIELLYRAVDIERHPGLKRAFSSRGRDVRDIHGVEELLDHGLHDLGHLLRAISSKLLCIRDSRTGTSRHSHLRLETLCASGPILCC